MKTIKYLFTLASLLVSFSFASYAFENSSTDSYRDVFVVDDSIINSIRKFVDFEIGDSESVRCDSIFTTHNGTYKKIKYSGKTLSVTSLHNQEASLSSQDLFMQIIRYDLNEDDVTNIIVNYDSENGSRLCFATSDGSIVEIDEFDSKTTVNNDGTNTTKLRLKEKDLERASCFRDESVFALRLMDISGNAFINSASVEMSKGGFSSIECIDSSMDLTIDTVGTIIVNTQDDTFVKFENDGKCLSLTSDKNCHIEEQYCAKGISICTEIDSSIGEELNETLESDDSSEDIWLTPTEDSEVELALEQESNEKFQTREELVEKSYSELNDGASSIYTDSYLFMSGDEASYIIGTGSNATDYLGQVYDGSAVIGGDSLYLDDVFELLGCNIEDIMLPSNSMQLSVANVKDADYAGELSFDTSGSAFALSKGNGDYFELDSTDLRLTELFLKKASYCGIDANGIICTSYDTDGYLYELADGYSEDDIAYYILIPTTLEDESDITVNSVTVKYNGILAADGYYFDMKVLNDCAEAVEPVSSFSGYYDGENFVDIGIRIDRDSNTVIYTDKSQGTEEIIAEEEIDEEAEEGTEASASDAEMIEQATPDNATPETLIPEEDIVEENDSEAAPEEDATPVKEDESEAGEEAVPGESKNQESESEPGNEQAGETNDGEGIGGGGNTTPEIKEPEDAPELMPDGDAQAGNTEIVDNSESSGDDESFVDSGGTANDNAGVNEAPPDTGPEVSGDDSGGDGGSTSPPAFSPPDENISL